MSLFDIQKFKSKISKILREFKYKLISLVQLSKFAKSQGGQRFNRVTPLEARILRLIAQMKKYRKITTEITTNFIKIMSTYRFIFK